MLLEVRNLVKELGAYTILVLMSMRCTWVLLVLMVLGKSTLF